MPANGRWDLILRIKVNNLLFILSNFEQAVCFAVIRKILTMLCCRYIAYTEMSDMWVGMLTFGGCILTVCCPVPRPYLYPRPT